MTRWPRCRRAQAGSSIPWSILTIDKADRERRVAQPRISTRSKQDDRDRSAYATPPQRRAVRNLHRFRSHAGARTACALAADQDHGVVPAGGLGDLADRILAQRLSENGHPAIVENRLGGNGIIATDAVAKSRADGYTLIMGNQRRHPDTAGHSRTRNPCFVPKASAYLGHCPGLP